MTTTLNNILKIIAITIGVLVVILLLLQITNYKLNLGALNFDQEKCIAEHKDDKLGRVGQADALNNFEIFCKKPSLFIYQK